MALKSRCPNTFITIWGRKAEQLQEILQLGLADSVETDPASAVRSADLVIFCTPVGAMEKLAAQIAPHLEPQALVTDAGSVKHCVAKKLAPLLGDRFLGGHPMAGSERSGLAAARADLFVGAPCILTPTGTTLPESLETITSFWNALGARVTTMSPLEHDRLVARLSHLPHAMAYALVNLVADTLPEEAPLLAGGSFRDGTRVAASDPILWSGILGENRHEVIAALREMSGLLDSLASNLEEEEEDSLLDFLTRAKAHRDRLPLPNPQLFPDE
jgi:prephenate dehydrogenase